MAKKVLLIRLDKIGDLICTLCVDQVSFLKDHDVHWTVAKGLSFVTKNAVPARPFLELKKDKSSLPEFRQFLRQFKPDIAVSFQAPWWIHFALWIEKVPVRAGVLSQWHSFLFLNKGLRQKRSRAELHESAYNLQLLEHAFSQHSTEPCPVLQLSAPRNAQLFEKFQLERNKYLVVHPGMAGSALNWPIPSYIEFIEKALLNYPVVLTGTPADEPWLKEIKSHFKDHTRVLILQNKLSAEELLTVLQGSYAVIAPSTGVAHLAASLGARVVGIYSPIKVQHPRRWAARGPRVQILTPITETVEDTAPEIMAKITADQILKSLSDFSESDR